MCRTRGQGVAHLVQHGPNGPPCPTVGRGPAAADSGLSFLKISPGNAIKGTVYFDVPKDTTLTSLELHDSMFSSGVKVKL